MQLREDLALDLPGPGDRRGRQLGVVGTLSVRSRRRPWWRPDGDVQPGGLQPRGPGGPPPRHHHFNAPYRTSRGRCCTGDRPHLIREPNVLDPQPRAVVPCHEDRLRCPEESRASRSSAFPVPGLATPRCAPHRRPQLIDVGSGIPAWPILGVQAKHKIGQPIARFLSPLT